MALALAQPARELTRRGTRPRVSVLAALQPLTVGAAPFNSAMVAALQDCAAVDAVSWSRPYPPFLYRGTAVDSASSPPTARIASDRLLAWDDPRTWARAVRRMAAFDADALVLPWLHPVATPPYRWLLQHAPLRTVRVVICHNVVPHERVRFGDALTRSVLRLADVLVLHAPHQRDELEALGIRAKHVVDAFHPCFDAADFAVEPTQGEVVAERARLGNPDLLLLCFGAVRPYKGVDLALEALARIPANVSVKLVVAGRFWNGTGEVKEQIRRLGLEARVELRDGYAPNEEAALLFRASDAALLPYRSATQSGVVGLSFAYERPVIVTAVGGLPDAVRNGVNGIVCAAGDPAAIAAAILRMASHRAQFAAGVVATQSRHSFGRYAELLVDAVEEVRR